MNNPIVLAAIGCVVSIVLYHLCGGIKQKFLRGLAQVGAILVPLALVGMMARDPAVSADAGQYYLFGIVGYVILSNLFGGKKEG